VQSPNIDIFVVIQVDRERESYDIWAKEIHHETTYATMNLTFHSQPTLDILTDNGGEHSKYATDYRADDRSNSIAT